MNLLGMFVDIAEENTKLACAQLFAFALIKK